MYELLCQPRLQTSHTNRKGLAVSEEPAQPQPTMHESLAQTRCSVTASGTSIVLTKGKQLVQGFLKGALGSWDFKVLRKAKSGTAVQTRLACPSFHAPDSSKLTAVRRPQML